MKKPRLKRDWIDRRVRALRPLSSGRFAVAVGTILRVQNNWGGLTLVTEACPTCGVRIYITKVPEGYVELLPIIEQPEFKGPRC